MVDLTVSRGEAGVGGRGKVRTEVRRGSGRGKGVKIRNRHPPRLR